MRKGEKGGEEAWVWVSVHKSTGGGFTGASSVILVQTPGWAPGTRTIQKLEYIKELPSDPAHLQPSPPWANLAGEWQNWTWSMEGDPGQKLGLPEAPILSLMGEGVAEKAAQLKALVTQSGSESACPRAEDEGEEEKSRPCPDLNSACGPRAGLLGPRRTGILPIMLWVPLKKSSPAHAILRHSLPGLLPHGLLSAGLSPKVLAISLKDGRSLGLRAQQRCIRR